MLQSDMIKLGAHLSIAGGWDKALDKAAKIGANCLQIFSGSPRLWARPQPDPDQIKAFKTKRQKLNIDPVVFHALYLINLAAFNQTAQKSVKVLAEELQLAERLGVMGSVVHLGSFLKHNPQLAYQELLKNMTQVLATAPPNVYFIIENAAGNKIGQSLDQIFQIFNDIKDKRLRLCWDTCHGFAAGIDLSSPDKLDRLLDQIDQHIGFDKLVLWHFNDSRDPFNSGRDRHENIGAGYIGLDTFRTIINHPTASRIPMIIETPGFDKKGPDKQNLDILKSLINS